MVILLFLGGIGALLFLLRSILLDQFVGMIITSSLIGIWLIVITIRIVNLILTFSLYCH
jgi:hypothetical protein